ncbi:hypothetical protein SAMN05421505_14318 [Sinosporangium album]|uniref:Uncharacterized protein n=2 Tax=Sinosporangium album TaxID=504805 RepID=A0A1G8JGG6_9ACTN|nr:hypothetical protein SAMN05421505_14318 [Sinosporangium album]
MPFAGIPAIGLMYVHRLNNISQLWADCADILERVLDQDSDKIDKVAATYTCAEDEAKAAAARLKR